MEEVVGWLVVALFKLLLWLLQLAFRLIWFAATGKWAKLGQGGQAEPKKKPARQAPAGRRRRLDVPVVPARPGSVFPFEFAPEQQAPEPMAELVEREPASEDEALRLERRRELLRRARERAHAKLQRPAVAHPQRSIRAAIRDRDTVRKAIVLGAALAPRRPL